MTLQTQTPTTREQFRATADATGLDVILLAEYGSRAYGTATESSDRDLLGIYVEHDHQIYGLAPAETQSYRLHASGELQQLGGSAHVERSAADIVELSFHPLRKYVSLAASGNPSVLTTLWSTTGALAIVSSAAAALLGSHREMFLSKRVGLRAAGYGWRQRRALLGEGNKRTNRPELVAQHGFDTKYASEMIRVLLVGLDAVRERTFHLPMKPEQVQLLQEIRRGELPLEDLLTLSEKLHQELIEETEDSDLPGSVDSDAVNELLHEIRVAHLSS